MTLQHCHNPPDHDNSTNMHSRVKERFPFTYDSSFDTRLLTLAHRIMSVELVLAIVGLIDGAIKSVLIITRFGFLARREP